MTPDNDPQSIVCVMKLRALRPMARSCERDVQRGAVIFRTGFKES